mgnify:CR=1 FL=1
MDVLNALEFYEGVEYAIDSLVSKDVRIHLSVYDTNDDSLTTALLLKEWRLKDVDFIISQNNLALQKMVNKYSMEHHIPLFTFHLNMSNEALKGNSNAWAAAYGRKALFEKLSEDAVVAADDVAELHFGEAAGAGAQKTNNLPDESAE